MEMIKALNLEPPSGKLLQSMRGSYIHSPLPSVPVHNPVVVVFRDGQPDQNVLPSTQGESGLPADPFSSLPKKHAKLESEVHGSSNMVMLEFSRVFQSVLGAPLAPWLI